MINSYESELNRIEHGPLFDEVPGGIGTVRFVVSCEDAGVVLSKAKQVLSTLLKMISKQWPTLDELTACLPPWFIQQCDLEQLDETSLSENERDRVSVLNPWSLEGWVGWFNPNDPDARAWKWWDAVILDDKHFVLAVEVESWPFAYGALSWLLRAAGACDVSPETESAQ